MVERMRGILKIPTPLSSLPSFTGHTRRDRPQDVFHQHEIRGKDESCRGNEHDAGIEPHRARAEAHGQSGEEHHKRGPNGRTESLSEEEGGEPCHEEKLGMVDEGGASANIFTPRLFT